MMCFFLMMVISCGVVVFSHNNPMDLEWKRWCNTPN